MNCNLAIYDNEPTYANHLMEYIKRKHKRLGQVRVFTNIKSLQEYAEQNQIQVLLLHEDLKNLEVEYINIKNICLLSEGNPSSQKDSCPVIYKYQSAEVIIKELLSFFTMEGLGAAVDVTNKQVKIICVYSPGMQDCRQKYALSLALGCTNQKRTLYISLDFYQALPELSGHNTENGLSEIIYYLKQNHSNLEQKLKEVRNKYQKLDYIPGVSFAPDLLELTVEDMDLWLKEMYRDGSYEVIIFDVGIMSQAVLELFQNSHEVLLLTEENTWEMALNNEFRRQLSWAGFDEIKDKIKPVLLTQEEVYQLRNIPINSINNLNSEESFNLTVNHLSLSKFISL